MAKSAKAQQAGRKGSAGGFLLGVFVGLLIGLAVALGIAFYINKTPLPFVAKGQPATKEGAAPGKTPPIAGLPQGGAGAGGAQEKPKFDFYKILPGNEQPVTDKELKQRLKESKGQPDTGGDVYYLQAGSFQNPAEADNQKAKLAILGFESSVEPTTLPDKGTWYRVRVGPYTRLDEINRARQTLKAN
jgi:cell division protein FtsN